MRQFLELRGRDVAARGCFDNVQNQTGWLNLDIETNEVADDEVQATAAGILEGFFTRFVAFLNKTFLFGHCITYNR